MREKQREKKYLLVDSKTNLEFVLMFDQLIEQVDDVHLLMDMDFDYKMQQELIVVVY